MGLGLLCALLLVRWAVHVGGHKCVCVCMCVSIYIYICVCAMVFVYILASQQAGGKTPASAYFPAAQLASTFKIYPNKLSLFASFSFA